MDKKTKLLQCLEVQPLDHATATVSEKRLLRELADWGMAEQRDAKWFITPKGHAEVVNQQRD